jgi:hypothetical protein
LIYDKGITSRDLRNLLEKYTFDDFKKGIQTWLKSGTYVWFVCGNYTTSGAIDLVENAR